MIAGIDWSTQAIDYALLPWESDDVKITTVRLPQGDEMIRLQSVQDALLGCMATTATRYPDSIWVEEAFGRFGNVTRKLLPMYGAIIAACPPGVAVASLSAVEWRKELGIPHGKKNKGEMLRIAREDNPGATFLDDNYAEAYLIAKAGRQIMRRHAA